MRRLYRNCRERGKEDLLIDRTNNQRGLLRLQKREEGAMEQAPLAHLHVWGVGIPTASSVALITKGVHLTSDFTQ